MINLILGVTMIVFAAVSLRDGARITSGYRVPGAFDLIGPDRYLIGVAVLIGAIGVAFLVQSIANLRKGTISRERQSNTEEDADYSLRHMVLVGVLVIYAMIMPLLGYTAASFVFFILTFRVMGLSNWKLVLPWSIAATLAFYVAFIQLADMSLPAGIFGIG